MLMSNTVQRWPSGAPGLRQGVGVSFGDFGPNFVRQFHMSQLTSLPIWREHLQKIIELCGLKKFRKLRVVSEDDES